MADISLTDRCNHKCPTCVGNMANREELSVEKWENIARDFAKCGVKSVKIAGGGEPILYQGYEEVIKNFKENGIDVGLVTNGTSLTEKQIKRIVPFQSSKIGQERKCQ